MMKPHRKTGEPLQKTVGIFSKTTKPPRRWVCGVRTHIKLRTRQEKRQNRTLILSNLFKKKYTGSPDSFGLQEDELPDIPPDAPLPTIRRPKNRLKLKKGKTTNPQPDYATPSTSRAGQHQDIPKSSPCSTPARY